VDVGHINFNDEVTAGLRLADGVLLVVDAVEGVMLVTDKVVRQAAAEGLPICLLLSKVSLSPALPVRCQAQPATVSGSESYELCRPS
jgi:predicted membrane GTPase involved in stress response